MSIFDAPRKTAGSAGPFLDTSFPSSIHWGRSLVLNTGGNHGRSKVCLEEVLGEEVRQEVRQEVVPEARCKEVGSTLPTCGRPAEHMLRAARRVFGGQTYRVPLRLRDRRRRR